jgi:hypothetical protein
MFRGISPRKLALTLAIGFAVGFLPVLWGATLLCAALASMFRLNQAIIQSANFLAYPVQVAMFVPFYRMGAIIFPWGPFRHGETLANNFRLDQGGEVTFVLLATLKAVGAWLIIAPPLAVLIYLIILPILARMPAVQSVHAGYSNQLQRIDCDFTLKNL